jgi:hypothetical protein
MTVPWFFSHSDAGRVAKIFFFSAQLSACKTRLLDNRLSLHLGKTILFGSKRGLKTVADFSITCGDKIVKRVKCVKYLGVFLNDTLSDAEQASQVLRKVYARLVFLYRYIGVLNQKTRTTLCTALIQPHLDYCAVSWYSSIGASLKKKVDIA